MQASSRIRIPNVRARKNVHALDRAATAIGLDYQSGSQNILSLTLSPKLPYSDHKIYQLVHMNHSNLILSVSPMFAVSSHLHYRPYACFP
jgi:hypothetical protein